MTLKAVLAAIAAIAVAVGLVLPVPHRSEAATESQVETISIGHG